MKGPRQFRKRFRKRNSPKISVIISGMPCVGKTTAANIIAERFCLDHLAGGDLLKQIAIESGYKPSGREWWDTAEGMTFLAERRRNSNFDKEVDKRLIERVTQGGVVVTSYPVPWICDKGLKIWFDASDETRARRLAGRDGISLKLAKEIVRERDLKNVRLYRRLYKIEFGKDLSVFNFIVDTEKSSAEEVARVAAGLVKNYRDSVIRAS